MPKQKNAAHGDILWRGLVIKPWYHAPRIIDFEHHHTAINDAAVRVSVKASFKAGVAFWYDATITVERLQSHGSGTDALTALEMAAGYISVAAEALP